MKQTEQRITMSLERVSYAYCVAHLFVDNNERAGASVVCDTEEDLTRLKKAWGIKEHKWQS